MNTQTNWLLIAFQWIIIVTVVSTFVTLASKTKRHEIFSANGFNADAALKHFIYSAAKTFYVLVFMLALTALNIFMRSNILFPYLSLVFGAGGFFLARYKNRSGIGWGVGCLIVWPVLLPILSLMPALCVKCKKPLLDSQKHICGSITVSANPSVALKLKQLQELLNQQLITAEEFETKRNEILREL